MHRQIENEIVEPGPICGISVKDVFHPDTADARRESADAHEEPVSFEFGRPFGDGRDARVVVVRGKDKRPDARVFERFDDVAPSMIEMVDTQNADARPSVRGKR